MRRKRTGKLVIEIGFKFGGDTNPQDELDALKENLISDEPNFLEPLPEKPTTKKRDKISKQLYDFFEEINKEKGFKSMNAYYNFYHVLEDPDTDEQS